VIRSLDPLQLTGRARTHLVDLADLGCAVHAHVAAPFAALRRAAAAAGFDLAPVSAFRDFARQLAIWNGKYETSALPPAQRIPAILQWSAVPGLSRHHWGTDFDLIDRKALPPGYRVSLVPPEYAPGGPFHALSEWLEAHAARFGFFRPYRGIRSGVQPEPWHFSFAPTAEDARRSYRPAVLAEVLAETPIGGRELILENLSEIHARYMDAIDLP
jgi:LAS superfamily LD-carboxypeptidase LdcB